MLFWVKTESWVPCSIWLNGSFDHFLWMSSSIHMSAFSDWKSAENMVLSLTALCRQSTVPDWKFLYRWFPAVQKHTLYLSGPKMSQQCISPFRLGLYWASQTAMVTVPLTPESKLSCGASKSHVNRNNYYSQRSGILPYSTPSRQSGPKGYFGTMTNDSRTHQSQNTGAAGRPRVTSELVVSAEGCFPSGGAAPTANANQPLWCRDKSTKRNYLWKRLFLKHIFKLACFLKASPFFWILQETVWKVWGNVRSLYLLKGNSFWSLALCYFCRQYDQSSFLLSF